MKRRCAEFSRLLAVAVATLAAVVACDRGSDGGGPRAEEAQRDRVPPPPVKPEYTFADSVRSEKPEIVAFLRQFLETCLAGDYAGYRMLASRAREPENRERFQAVYYAIRRLVVESIERVELPELSDEAYLVVCDLELNPESRARLRRKCDKIAILVLAEEGEWRMLPAPPEWQPAEAEAPASTSGPTTTSAPSYPWDEDGDF